MDEIFPKTIGTSNTVLMFGKSTMVGTDGGMKQQGIKTQVPQKAYKVVIILVQIYSLVMIAAGC
jgi:hypothetical protein